MRFLDRLLRREKRARETDPQKSGRFLFVKKFVSPEELEKQGLKHGVFLMHERDLPQYPWIKRAIVELQGARPTELSEEELNQFHKMSAGTSAILLSLVHGGPDIPALNELSVKALYLLRLAP